MGMFKIMGVLVRDIIPDRRDLEGAFKHLDFGLHPDLYLEMLGLYMSVPIPGILKIVGGGENIRE